MVTSIGSLLKGLLGGAALMYIFDPDRGRRRRALSRDRAVALTHDLEALWRKGTRDLANRAMGTVAEARGALQNGPVDDRVLIDHVRSVLGHHIDHARRVEVDAHGGLITLRGTLRPGEPERIVPAVEAIPGVREIECALETEGPPVPPAVEHRAMRPGTQLLLTAGGGALLMGGLLRRGVLSKAGGICGAGMLAQGLMGKGPLRWTDSGRRAIESRAGLSIAAPIEKVFEFISDVQQSDRFLPASVDVESLGEGRVRWSIRDADGTPTLECEEVLLESVENDKIVWASTEESPLRYVAEARFRPDGADATRVDVAFIYAPPGGALGHTAASLFGVDPQTLLEESLARIKRALEQSTVPESPAPAAEPTQHG